MECVSGHVPEVAGVIRQGGGGIDWNACYAAHGIRIREGWHNPNIFIKQRILQKSKSLKKKT